MSEFQIRPQQLRKIEAGLIDAHPLNFRVHTDKQKSKLSAIMAEIGFVGTLIVRPYGDKGRYQCLDGHERLSRFDPKDKVPCLVVRLSDEEAAKFLATFDTITGLAETDRAALEQLTAGLEWEHDGLDDLIADTLAGADAMVSDALDDMEDVPDSTAADDSEPEADQDPQAKVPKATHECPKCGFQWKGEARPGK